MKGAPWRQATGEAESTQVIDGRSRARRLQHTAGRGPTAARVCYTRCLARPWRSWAADCSWPRCAGGESAAFEGFLRWARRQRSGGRHSALFCRDVIGYGSGRRGVTTHASSGRVPSTRKVCATPTSAKPPASGASGARRLARAAGRCRRGDLLPEPAGAANAGRGRDRYRVINERRPGIRPGRRAALYQRWRGGRSRHGEFSHLSRQRRIEGSDTEWRMEGGRSEMAVRERPVRRSAGFCGAAWCGQIVPQRVSRWSVGRRHRCASSPGRVTWRRDGLVTDGVAIAAGR